MIQQAFLKNVEQKALTAVSVEERH